jgi:hypothetical protein
MWIVNIPARKSATIKLITTRTPIAGLRDSPTRVRELRAALCRPIGAGPQADSPRLP